MSTLAIARALVACIGGACLALLAILALSGRSMIFPSGLSMNFLSLFLLLDIQCGLGASGCLRQNHAIRGLVASGCLPMLLASLKPVPKFLTRSNRQTLNETAVAHEATTTLNDRTKVLDSEQQTNTQ